MFSITLRCSRQFICNQKIARIATFCSNHILQNNNYVFKTRNHNLNSKHLSSFAPQLEWNDASYPKSSPIKSVKMFTDECIVQINFFDGKVINFNSIWLRDSCQCPKCLHPVTFQKLINCAEIKPDIIPDKVSYDNEKMILVWREEEGEHVSTYDIEWLKTFLGFFGDLNSSKDWFPNDGIYAPKLPFNNEIYWDKSIIESTEIKVDYEKLMQNEVVLKNVVDLLCIYGIAFINNVPTEKGEILKVARRIAYERKTGYGKTFDVTYNPDPNAHLSYTGTKIILNFVQGCKK